MTGLLPVGALVHITNDQTRYFPGDNRPGSWQMIYGDHYYGKVTHIATDASQVFGGARHMWDGRPMARVRKGNYKGTQVSGKSWDRGKCSTRWFVQPDGWHYLDDLIPVASKYR